MIKDFIKENKIILLFTLSILLLFISTTSVMGAMNDSIIMYLSFDEGLNSTHACDITGTIPCGTLVGSTKPTNITGKRGNALHFVPANGNYIQFPIDTKLDFRKNLTITAWVNYITIAGAVVDKGYNGATANNPYRLSDMSATSENFGSYDSGYGWKNIAFKSIATNVFIHVAVRFNGTHISAWVNGTQRGEVAFTDSMTVGGYGMTVGAYNSAGTMSDYMNGDIDEIGIWNRSLTQSEIIQLASGNVSGFYPFTDIVPDTATISFETRGRNGINISSMVEDSPFIVKANFSINGASVGTANCTFLGGNMSSYFFLNSSTNISLTGANDVKLNTSPSALHPTTIGDKYRFRVCRESVSAKPIDVYINGALFNTIVAGTIPPCTSGFHEEIVTTATYKSLVYFNMSIRCPTCTAIQTMRIIPFGQYNDIIQHIRLYNPHPEEEMIYNTTDKFYYPDDYHTYPNTQVVNITVRCTNATIGANSTRAYIIGDNVPVSKIETLTDSSGERAFTDGMSVESGNVTIIGGCSNDSIVYTEMNVTYTNLTLVAASYAYNLDIDTTLLKEDANYNVTLRCIDDEGNSTVSKGWFTLADTTIPILTWVSPISDNSTVIYQNQTLNIDVTSSDLNLFSMEVICKDSLGVIKYSNYSENLSQVFQVMGTSSQITNLGQGECNVTVKDKHTDNDITDKNIIEMQDKDRISFIYGGVKLNITASGFSPDSFITKKEIDRITFYPKVGTIPSELTYYTDCENGKLLYYDDGAYDGKNRFGKYFNCGDLWIDYYMPNVPSENYHVTVISSSRARTTIRLPTALNKGTLTPLITTSEELMTRSVGIRNIISEYVRFNVTAQPEMPETPELLTTPGAILLGVLSLLWIAMVAFGFLFMPILTYIGGLFGIFLAFLFMTTYTTMGIVFIFVNILLMFFNYIATSGTEE